MTEDEAKTKWCPFVRAVLPGTTLPAGNRGVGPDGTEGVKGARCIASACMAWRWDERTDYAPVRQGYCGLAGSPS